MKPTQQEIIDLAREAGIVFDERAMPYYERLVHLALERFGAGGGEPVAWIDGTDLELMRKDGRGCIAWGAQKHSNATTPLYTHPSPTDLRAEYLRGLEDAKKEVEQFNVDGVGAIVDAIEALKGKQ